MWMKEGSEAVSGNAKSSWMLEPIFAGGESSRGVQHADYRLHASQDGYECGSTQNCKFT